MRFTSLLWLALLLILLIGCPRFAWAWDAGGHEIVAWVAMDHLNAKAKARLEELTPLVKGPNGSFNPINLATWMDVIKGKDHLGMPFTGLYMPWHYVDFGLEDSDPSPALIPGGDNEKVGNVLLALQRIAVVLKGGTDPYIPSQEIACAMALHLVGDIHQPLHATTEFYYSPSHRLEDDRGGNSVAILNSPPNKKAAHLNLHALWDVSWRISWDPGNGQVVRDDQYEDHGSGVDPESVRSLARQWQIDYAPPAGTSMEPDFLAWAKESNKLGRDIAFGHLLHSPGSSEARVTEIYVHEANDLAKRRLVLAGLRLAQFLNETIGADDPGPVPTPWPVGPPAPALN